MNCKNCGKENSLEAKFCETCGTSLNNSTETILEKQAISNNGETNHSTVPSSPGHQQYLEKGKVISKMYASFFLSNLKKPVSVAENITRSQLTNGFITIILFSLMLPLITYMGLKHTFSQSFYSPDISFMNVVIIPLVSLIILIILITLVIFGVVKIGGTSVNYLDTLARFGAFLVVPTALLLLATFFSIINSVIFIPFLLLGLVGASLVTPFIIFSLKKDDPRGLDTFYCTILTYIGIFILFFILGEQAFNGLVDAIDMFSLFDL